MAKTTTTTTTKTTTSKITTATNAKEIQSLTEKINQLESQVKALQEQCTVLAASNTGNLPDDVLTRKDWDKLKKALSSVKMPARAANLM